MKSILFRQLAVVRIVFLALCCCLLLPGYLSAQCTVFKPVAVNEARIRSLTAELETRYKTTIAALPAANRKDYEAIYKERWENIKSILDKQEVYTAPFAQSYLDKIAKTIIAANPVLKEEKLHLFFSRSAVPNASFIGEGVILFNMGLFSTLSDESQVAFVLCHELAHYYLRHSDNSISRYVTTMNSKEVQSELKQIKNSEFNKKTQLEKLMKGISFDSRRHSRDHESEADSMGLVFLSRTNFDLNAAITTLELLDNVDEDTLDAAKALQKLFDAKNYPFKKKWISKKEGLLGGHAVLEKDEALADSLKTHPDCRRRIQTLQPFVKAVPQNNRLANPIDKNTFDSLRITFRYEPIAYEFEREHYTRSLYAAIKQLGDFPEDPFLITQIGKIFNSCYDAQQEHTLGKRIDLPAPQNSSGYNTVLQMVQNLYAADFPAIGFNFLEQYQTKFGNCTVFNTELEKARQRYK
ncbi:Peptidase family M48 [Chitinophaga jiangningensis]|uniref:Peptidase family M48 n=1 Tax=Chitinophaga jiangningensis TaxID=1419482 RepID=A0A1M6VM47_9BACT|nr:M48 family metallopeptidase [Chitinophaga jiangningensis]SHK82568.1 Peptidase family M48 [Chitinophaga jiangningensis]